MDGYAKTALWAIGAAVLVLGTILAVSIDWNASFPEKHPEGPSHDEICTSVCERASWNDAKAADLYLGFADMCEAPCSEYIPTTIRPLQPAPQRSESCCTYCTIGKACGDSCIAAGDSCYVASGCACNK